MKPTELRLDNLILYNGNVITAGDCWDKILYGFSEFRAKKGDSIEPIPLTEQWLKDFGFFDDNKADRDRYETFTNINWCLNGETPLSRYFRVYQQLNKSDWKRTDIRDFEFGEFMVYANQWWTMSVKYVHELQNLYFALTGEELVKE